MEFHAETVINTLAQPITYLGQVVMSDGAIQESKRFNDHEQAWKWAKKRAKEYNED